MKNKSEEKNHEYVAHYNEYTNTTLLVKRKKNTANINLEKSGRIENQED